MRPRMLLTLVGAWFTLTALVEPLPAQMRHQSAVVAASVGTTSGRDFTLRVEGPYQLTREEAYQAALQAAQEEVARHLRLQGVRVDNPPSTRYVESKMLRHQQEETRDFQDVGTMRRYILQVQVSSEVRRDLWQQEREQRTQQRMVWLGKLLGGMVIFLAAVAVYFRIDEWTKGYYTNWLRLAAAGCILATVLVLML